MSRRTARDRQSQEENHERWLVSYADFITLLFAFFIVLYATSERDAEKTKSFQESMKKFLMRAGGATGAGGGVEVSVNEAQKNNSPIAPPLPTFKTSSDLAGEVMAEVEVVVEEQLTEGERQTYGLDLSQDTFGVKVSVDASQLFTDNSVLFERSGLKVIDVIGFILQKVDNKIVIESHVDQQEKRPTPYDSDWKLSAARSAQVVQYLINRHQLDSQRLVAMGHGSERPIYPHSDSKLKGKNQRLEFLIVTEESPF